jgi:energy-coupling factor transport system permease protein
MFSMNIVMLIISLVCSFILFFHYNGIKSKSDYIFSIIIFVAISIINPLVSHNGITVLFVLNNSPITLEAVIYGIASACMVVSILYWFKTFSHIMTSDKVIYTFGKLSSKLALIISMALRYIPLFKQQASKINKTQKALGAYREDNIIDTIKMKIKVFSVLITWTLENGIVTANSMDARGYGVCKRTSYSDYRVKFADIAFLIISFIFFCISALSMYNVNQNFYPEFILINNNISKIGYVSYCCLALLPLLIQVKEIIKWKYSEQKI